MSKIDLITNELKKKIDLLKNNTKPIVVFIGGIPGSGKSLLIEKTTQIFQDRDFSIIEPDLYRKYFKDAKYVEETVNDSNIIEKELLFYSIENKKDIIHISSIRSYEYIDNLINDYLKPLCYDIYLYIMVTNEVESAISTYERYLKDLKNKEDFPRINKEDYLIMAYEGFKKGVEYFGEINAFNEIHIFKRGKDMTLPTEIKYSSKSIVETIKKEEERQKKELDYNKINIRVNNIKKNLNIEERKEFDKVVKGIIFKGGKEQGMKQIINKKNEKYAKQCFEEAIDMGLKFKIEQEVNKKHVDEDFRNKMLDLPNKEKSVDKIIEEFKNEVLPYCTNFSNEKFTGFPDAGNSISGMTGAILADFLQQNLINSSFCAPAATVMEIAVVKWLREIIGYKINKINSIWDAGGIITYGGTGSNTTAMLLARENFHKDTMIKGVKDPSQYKIIIPKGIGHYSIRSGSMWIGCGDNIVEVETKDFKYDLKALKAALRKYKGEVMCVVAYVGDSRTMTIDNLKEIHDIVKKTDKNIWLHADACHGFSLAFSKKLKKKIEGLELFDSISTDPHKVLAIPYCISALLVKEPEKMKLITSTSDLIMQEDFAYGQITPFIGSKSWISLKLWFSMKSFGVEGYGKLIEKRCEMAQYLKQQIEKSKNFVVLNDVNINSVVFMYVKDKENLKNIDIEELNKKNIELYNKLMQEGKYYLHKFSIPDNKGVIKKDTILYPLRYMSGNDNITKKDIRDMLKHIEEIADEKSLCETYNEMIRKKFNNIIKSVIIYGSNIYNKSSSDLDVCIVTKEIDESIKKKMILETIQFHKDHNLKIDEEIPFNNKLIYSEKELKEMVNNSPFYKKGKVMIKDIQKSKRYLKSKEMKHRLLLNILTTDHVTYGKSTAKYEKLAWKIIIDAITKFYNIDKKNESKILKCMYQNQYTKAEGEFYLGYKENYKQKEEYLKKKIHEVTK